jgi:hypothetical protein
MSAPAKPVTVIDLEAPATAERVEVATGPTARVDVSMHKRTRYSGVAACGMPTKQDQLTDGMEFDCRRCWIVYTGRT